MTADRLFDEWVGWEYRRVLDGEQAGDTSDHPFEDVNWQPSWASKKTKFVVERRRVGAWEPDEETR